MAEAHHVGKVLAHEHGPDSSNPSARGRGQVRLGCQRGQGCSESSRGGWHEHPTAARQCSSPWLSLFSPP